MHTSETQLLADVQDLCVPTRSEWPQEAFLEWLDGLKQQLRLASDNQLAGHFGIGHTLISGWRNNRQRPSIETLNKMATVLREDPRRLWVLAGLANADEVGLTDVPAGRIYGEPEVIRRLMAIYVDERLTESDLGLFVRQLELLASVMENDLAGRKTNPKRSRRAV